PNEQFDTEKKESLKSLLLAIWKKNDEPQKRSEYVALSKALQLYFDHLKQNPNITPCFNTFYEFLQTDFTLISTISKDDFDLSNFLFVLTPYYKGGEFEYLLNAAQNPDLLNERFIVFELDAIKSHPILYPVTSLIIMEIAISKMRKLKNVFKAIIIEEAWKPITEEGMSDFMRWLEKTARKFFTKIIVSTQEIEDLIASPVLCKTIVNNSDTIILLDQSKLANRFAELQQLLSITDAQKTEILSLNQGREPNRRYKDVWIRVGPSHSRVYRIEVSDEEYCVYTSEQKEKIKIKQYASRFGSLKAGIQALVQEAREKGGKLFLAITVLLTATITQAQIPIIGTGVDKITKALDLQVQRQQTQTILLQQAQKIIENTMSQLYLQDIRSWVLQQKDLYQNYFQELTQIKTVISSFHRISELINQQQQITARIKQTLSLLKSTPLLSPTELDHITTVYTGLLKECETHLDNLLLATTPSKTTMTDPSRLTLINRIADDTNQTLTNLNRFTAENALLLYQRAADDNDIQTIKKLYAL
ncbi:MAG: TraG family conjugative transposon ATPase, partial [Bacteroidetes bacterium]|nr:TraG family conjugative transposon ATPase [Bacteroidota bacterium]